MIDPDASLLPRIARGEREAVRALVEAKLPRMLGFATRLLHDRGEAEDVAQEAFLRAWRHASSWRKGEARFETWLLTVVLNLCRDRLRTGRPSSGDAIPDVADPRPDAESALMHAQRGQAVADEISKLPERQREAIMLIHYQDLPGAEAAAMLGIGVDALESLLARARRTLRARLAERRGLGVDA